MGAWGEGPYDNDTALDWLGETGGSLDAIAEALNETLSVPVDDYLDADQGTVCVAACQALVDYHKPKMPGLVARIFGKQPVIAKPKLQLVDKAAAALDRVVAENSELAELWEEAEPNAWPASIGSLRRQLANIKDHA